MIVGENGVGKSTLMEVLEFAARLKGTTLPEYIRSRHSNWRARVELTWNDGNGITFGSNPLQPEQLDSTTTRQGPWAGDVRIIPPRREIPVEADGLQSDRAKYNEAMPLSLARQSDVTSLRTRSRRWQVSDCKVGTIASDVLGQPIAFRTEGPQLRILVDSEEVPIVRLGRGTVSVLHICDAIEDMPDGATLVIDEPELSLHPRSQRQLLTYLLRTTVRCQVLIVTHSPHCVSWDAVENGGRIVRVHRTEPGRSRVSMLGQDAARGILDLRRNLHFPHTLGIDATEALFLADRVILVEGQEDVVCYRRIAEVVDSDVRLIGEFYGWGVGGDGNMRRIAAMLRDLGFVRVVGILDRNAEAGARKSGLEQEFPGFRFLIQPMADVRDKDGGVKGLCDRHFNLHPEHRDAVVQLFRQVNEALAGAVGNHA